MKNKSMLTLLEYSSLELEQLILFASELKKERKQKNFKKRLQSKNIALVFQKPSTRTRIAASVACTEEGAYSEFFNVNDIQLGHKESIADTARVFGRIFDGMVFRGFSQCDLDELEQNAGIPIWNGLTDEHHPTQALSDLMTIYEKFNTFKGIKVAFLGDASNNVAKSLMIACSKLGVSLTLGAPSSLWPDRELIQTCQGFASQSGATLNFEEDPTSAVVDSDVVYTDVWASMGDKDPQLVQEKNELLSPYQVNQNLLKAAGNSEVFFMHCLPAEKGKEVTADVFESSRSLVFDAAENKLHTFKAVMIASLCGIEEVR